MTTVIKMDERVVNIISALEELQVDTTIPRNVKTKIEIIVKALKNEEEEFIIRKDKALNELDEISEDTNIQSYTRTQVWNIVSALEMI
jgi:uncharacterized protein